VDSKPDRPLESGQTTETGDTRRDVARKLGRFAAYAAPFTVLALAKKADAGGTSGPSFTPHGR
jgi:hypothetical protein